MVPTYSNDSEASIVVCVFNRYQVEKKYKDIEEEEKQETIRSTEEMIQREEEAKKARGMHNDLC